MAARANTRHVHGTRSNCTTVAAIAALHLPGDTPCQQQNHLLHSLLPFSQTTLGPIYLVHVTQTLMPQLLHTLLPQLLATVPAATFSPYLPREQCCCQHPSSRLQFTSCCCPAHEWGDSTHHSSNPSVKHTQLLQRSVYARIQHNVRCTQRCSQVVGLQSEPAAMSSVHTVK